MDNQGAYPDFPLEQDEFYPCKGCGETLEEGKAFELGMSDICVFFNRFLMSLTCDSWKPMAHRLFPMQHMQHSA
ncbi:hypothetical protein PDIG_15400 [Penicillium digitatum PHI26]|uniref:Uncharacterized protein n=2 Tax=Penicillium digitatum TaxID=36651 RepID=K9GWL2_PEND2|nr:hypothetical protein PDIP_30930 [Penicillium digitatum Pd1]EKV17416.1 hypothetical protein PDIG_15400 [Penicillium digitatum PHI26]EKV17578.1 hypothetical protein PDIP_30930 [Penicillium digitatum Pd1]